MSDEDFAPEIGQSVIFTGYTAETDDEKPDNFEALDEGETYKVLRINEETDEVEESIVLEASNPDFDESKRASAKNKRNVEVIVFTDEIGEDEGEGEGEGEGEEAAEEEKPKKRASTKKKAPAKKAPANKAPAKKLTAAEKRKATAAKKKADAAAKKKAEAKKDEEEDEDLRGMIILGEDEENEEILEMVKEADDLCELAQELSEESINADYKLAGILYHTRISKAFRQIEDGKYDIKGGFQAYVEGALPIGYRKAMNLIEIYTGFNKHGLGEDVLGELGWTKAAQIVKAMTDDNAEELVDIARESSVADLKETVKETYDTKSREVVKKVGFRFRLAEDEGKTVQDLLEQAKKSLGLKKDEEVFAHIVTEWAAEHLEVSKVRKTRRSAKK